MTTELARQHAALQSLVLAEDDPDDVYLFRKALDCLDNTIRLEHFADGDTTMDYLRRTLQDDPQQLPRLVLLDLNMPGNSGKEILRQIKSTEGLKRLPVIVFTTSSNHGDVEDCYAMGANSYIVKPRSFGQMVHTLDKFKHYWFDTVQLYPSERLY